MPLIKVIKVCEPCRSFSSESSFDIQLSRSACVENVKEKISETAGVEMSLINVFYRGQKIEAGWYVSDVVEGEPLVYTIENASEDIRLCGVESIANLKEETRERINTVLEQIRKGFRANKQPELAVDGSGGTYFLKDSGGVKIACFKPCDEEPACANNPRELRTMEGNVGILAGEAMEREVAAFLTDTDGFSGVPLTILVEARHSGFHFKNRRVSWKVGSLQIYVNADSTASDFSPHLFSADQVHKIALLDIRLLNMDRNDSNLLVRKVDAHEYELIPVDHGYCMPDHLMVTWFNWCWLDWPQSRQPFSQTTLQWISDYSIEDNIRLLREQLNIRECCLDNLRYVGIMMKKGAAAGLCLHDIASMIARQEMDTPSAVEHQVARSNQLAQMMMNNARVRGDSSGESDLRKQLASKLSVDTSCGRSLKRCCSLSDIIADTPKDSSRVFKEETDVRSPETDMAIAKRHDMSLNYFRNLVDDLILSVQDHRTRDHSFFRESSLYYLTSPHRPENTIPYSFWDGNASEEEDSKSISTGVVCDEIQSGLFWDMSDEENNEKCERRENRVKNQVRFFKDRIPVTSSFSKVVCSDRRDILSNCTNSVFV